MECPLTIAFTAHTAATLIMMLDCFVKDNEEIVASYRKAGSTVILCDGTIIKGIFPGRKETVLAMRFDQVIVADSGHGTRLLPEIARLILCDRMSYRVDPSFWLQFYSA